MAANITLSEAAYLAETLLPYLTVDESRMGTATRGAFLRFRFPRSIAKDAVSWRRVIDDVLRPLILDAVRRTGGRSGLDPVRLDGHL